MPDTAGTLVQIKMNGIRTILLLLSFLQMIGCSNTATRPKTCSDKIKDSTGSFPPYQKTDNSIRHPLLRSKDFGQTWINISQGLPPEAQVSFMERMGNEIIIATDNLGVFSSTNNRTQWKRIGTNLPNQKINALHFVENTIFVGVYREGIFKSEDEGITWNSINYNIPNLNVQTIWQFEGELYAGTDMGIFRLSKNEKFWKSTAITTQVLSIYEYEGILVAGTSQGTVISKDKGNSWDWIRKEGAVHYTHNIGMRVVELALNGDLVYTDDWGLNWIEMEYEPRTGSYVYEIVKVGEYLLLSNNYGIHRSIDNGQSWEHIFKTESFGFFDLIAIGNDIYGGTRTWNEYRKRNE